MSKIPTMFNDKMIELAQNAANAYVTTNEKLKQASVDEFLEVYLDVFTLAYSKVEKRVSDRDKEIENFDDCEILPNNPIR